MQGHASSWLPEGYDWQLVWRDEFDGTELDRSKWDYRLCMMGRRNNAWTEDGVTLDGNSNAVFRRYEKDGKVYSSQLQTGANFTDAPAEESKGVFRWQIGRLTEPKYLKQYGYFECRCKLQKKNGWWSAFWLQSPIIGSSLDPAKSGIETDIMESFEPSKVERVSNHYNGYNSCIKTERFGDVLENVDLNEYHTFGILWTEEGYVRYIDGVENGRSSAPISHTPQFVSIGTEVMGYRETDDACEIAKADPDDEFIVDYVRVFDYKKSKK